MKRWLSLLLCVGFALCPLTSLANNEPEPVSYPQHCYTYEEGTVVENGIRAVQDFELGTSLNEALLGWMYGGVLQGGYAVMAGSKDDYYANHTYRNRAKNGRGCFYFKENDAAVFSGRITFLYGATSKNAPFEKLSQLGRQEVYDANPYIRLLTPEGDYQLDIFAIFPKSEMTNEEMIPPQDAAAYANWLTQLTGSSLVRCLPEALPQYGERILVLSTNAGRKRGIVMATLRPIRYDTDESYALNKWELDHRAYDVHWVDVGTLGKKRVYFQKDPLWATMRFESAPTSKYRVVSGGACGPFTLANILINILEPEELTALDRNSPDGFGAVFCSCSVNLLYCNHSHIPYRLGSVEEYVRYLPVIVCNFCSGNNPYGVVSRWPNGTGTNTIYVPYVCQALSLSCMKVGTLMEGIEMVRDRGNRGALLCCALDGSPFSPPGSTHFVSIIGVDEENYVYVLDSIDGQSYKKRGANVVEKVEDGLGRFLLDYANGVSLSPYYYIEKPADGESPVIIE